MKEMGRWVSQGVRKVREGRKIRVEKEGKFVREGCVGERGELECV